MSASDTFFVMFKIQTYFPNIFHYFKSWSSYFCRDGIKSTGLLLKYM